MLIFFLLVQPLWQGDQSGDYVVYNTCIYSSYVFRIALEIKYTLELHFSGLIETTRHPHMQKFRIIGFFFENRLLWQFEVENISYERQF
jgi:hypothetical protein